MSDPITLADAKAHLSALVNEAEAGSEFVITRHGRPVARLTGVARGVTRTPGDWGWKGAFDPAVLAPMTDAEQREEGWPV